MTCDGHADDTDAIASPAELWFPEWEFGLPFGAGGGDGGGSASDYTKFSPDAHVSNWHTPTLVIHGGKDYRCVRAQLESHSTSRVTHPPPPTPLNRVVETEAISTFTALQRRRVPSRFLHFPDEGHWVTPPLHPTHLCWNLCWIASVCGI